MGIVIMLSAMMLSVFMLKAIMKSLIMLSAQMPSVVLKSSHYVDVVMPRMVATMGTYPQHFIFFKTNEWAQ